MKSVYTRLYSNDSGVAAIEFAFIAPVFLIMLFGIITFGIILGTIHGVQQLASEAARASVAGLSASERTQIAANFVTQNVGAYAFLDPAKLQVMTSSQTNIFQVTLVYDMSATFVFRLGTMVPLPSPVITRTAAIQNGGF